MQALVRRDVKEREQINVLGCVEPICFALAVQFDVNVVQ